MSRSLSLAACLATLCCSCALPPPEDDVVLGSQVAATTEADYGLYDDPALQLYVASVADRVAAQIKQTPFEYRFRILDQPEPNAFAAPGGFVYVSRGMLALTQSEDELAGVLGHEITHVEKRHTAQSMQPRPIGSLLLLPGRLVALIAPRIGNTFNLPLERLRALRMARYGRGQETESDRLGQELAAAAGYDPAALATVLDRMERVVGQMVGKTRRPSFFDTHPPTPTRVDEVKAHARDLQAAPRSPEARDDDAFVQGLDGLVWGENPTHGEFRGNVFVDPGLSIAITFPESWLQTHTAQFVGATAGDTKTAVFFSLTAMASAGIGSVVEAGKLRARKDGYRTVRELSLEADGRTLRMLEFRPTDGGDETLLMAWVEIGQVIGEFVAIGPSAAKPQLIDTITSLRSLTTRERLSFTVSRIRVVKAIEGETLRELVLRLHATGSVGMTAALNGLDSDAPLQKGQLVKVIREEPFL